MTYHSMSESHGGLPAGEKSGKGEGVSDNWLSHYRRSLDSLSRNARLYLLGAFFFGLTHANFQLLFNLYLRERGATESLVGSVLSYTAVGAALMALPAGITILNVRLKPVLLGATTIYAVAMTFLAGWEDMRFLWLFALIAGMAITFYRVAGAPFFMRNSAPAERPLLFSLGFAMMTLAGALGSLGSGQLVSHLAEITGDLTLSYRYSLFAGIGLGLFSIIPFSLIRSRPPSAEEGRQMIDWSSIQTRLGLYARIISPFFIVGLGAGLTIPFLNIYFRDRFDKGPETIGLYFFGVQGAMFLGAMLAPILVRKIGKVRTIVSTQLLSIPFMLVLAMTKNVELAVAAFVLRAGLMNIGHPVGTNFAMEIVDQREQGLVNALMLLAWTSSWTIATSVGGTLIETYGYTEPIMVTTVLYVISSALYFLLFRKHEFRHNGIFVTTDRERST